MRAVESTCVLPQSRVEATATAAAAGKATLPRPRTWPRGTTTTTTNRKEALLVLFAATHAVVATWRCIAVAWRGSSVGATLRPNDEAAIHSSLVQELRWGHWRNELVPRDAVVAAAARARFHSSLNHSTVTAPTTLSRRRPIDSVDYHDAGASFGAAPLVGHVPPRLLECWKHWKRRPRRRRWYQA